jgi:hypothetical protein
MKKLDYNIELVENFLNNEDYLKLCSVKLDDLAPQSIKVYHNRINKNNEIVESCLSADLIKDLHKNYHGKAISILKKLCPEKLELYDYSDFTITKSGKDFKSSFHDDTPDKILSGVIYLHPTRNAGTIFSDNKNGKNQISIDWKINKAVFFSRHERKTWHAYQGDGISDRIALVYNLYTNNLKKVFQIEKKNFYLGNFRYKINPYLFRYLKLTI